MSDEDKESIDDRIKEAELKRIEAEAARAQAEKAKLDFDLKALNRRWWKPRQPFRALIAVIVIIPLFWFYFKELVLPLADIEKIKQAKDFAEILKFQQAKVDSLDLEKMKITATIDSLKIRAIISAVFGDLDSLKYANVLKHYKTIKANDYYDSRLNPDGGGIENELDVRDVDGGTVIYDAATKLTWQGGSEFSRMDWIKAKAYVDTLSYAGHGDWRLPTLEEVMSLMEPKTIENELHGAPFNELHVDARFRDTPDIWTADVYDASVVWSVFFVSGRCEHSHVNFNDFVRAVR